MSSPLPRQVLVRCFMFLCFSLTLRSTAAQTKETYTKSSVKIYLLVWPVLSFRLLFLRTCSDYVSRGEYGTQHIHWTLSTHFLSPLLLVVVPLLLISKLQPCSLYLFGFVRVCYFHSSLFNGVTLHLNYSSNFVCPFALFQCSGRVQLMEFNGLVSRWWIVIWYYATRRRDNYYGCEFVNTVLEGKLKRSGIYIYLKYMIL